MKKQIVLKELKEDVKNGYGEILEITSSGVLYYDYEEQETFYRFEEKCTEDNIKELMFISKEAEQRGVTKNILWDILVAVFGNDLPDAICTLNGIMVVSSETDFYEFLDKIDTHTSSNLREWYEWEDLEGLCGIMYSAFKIVVVNEKTIAKLAAELGDEFISEDEEYATGIIQTLIHEVRHLMLDTNSFLPVEIVGEDEYETASGEDTVEAFCRQAYEKLPKNLQIMSA